MDDAETLSQSDSSPVAETLSQGLLNIYQPHLNRVKMDLRELLAKQNNIYIDFQSEKFNFVDNNISDVESMMLKYKAYKEKLTNIKKEMTSIHHRTKSLKKRAQHIQTCKEKELATKILRRQQEEALIGKHKSQRVSTSEN